MPNDACNFQIKRSEVDSQSAYSQDEKKVNKSGHPAGSPSVYLL